MQKDEAIALPAGRKLDEQIAIAVFGWRWLSYVGIPIRSAPNYPDHCRVRQFYPPDEELDVKYRAWLDTVDVALAVGDEPLSYDYCSSMGPRMVPAFSESIEAAWQVVEKLKQTLSYGIWETSDIPSVQQHPFVVFRANVYPPMIPVAKDNPEIFCAYGETVPLAICRAALKYSWKD